MSADKAQTVHDVLETDLLDLQNWQEEAEFRREIFEKHAKRTNSPKSVLYDENCRMQRGGSSIHEKAKSFRELKKESKLGLKRSG